MTTLARSVWMRGELGGLAVCCENVLLAACAVPPCRDQSHAVCQVQEFACSNDEYASCILG